MLLPCPEFDWRGWTQFQFARWRIHEIEHETLDRCWLTPSAEMGGAGFSSFPLGRVGAQTANSIAASGRRIAPRAGASRG